MTQVNAAASQQSPTQYPTLNDPNKEPTNPEFSSEAPPSYSDHSKYSPPAYPPTYANSGYPSADLNYAGSPPGYLTNLGNPTVQHESPPF